MKRIRVALGDRSYNIFIGSGILGRAGNMIKRLGLGKDPIIITNDEIKKRSPYRQLIKTLRSSGYIPHTLAIPGKETSKSFDYVVKLTEGLVGIDKGEGIFIIVLGGGMTGDVAGYVASAYKRGIPYIQIPTTLLAQVDSAIGGKTAIDLPAGKNLIGAFYQPRLVISDILLLSGLPGRIFRSGLGEVIKYGVIADKGLFEYIEKNINKILDLDRGSLEYIVYRSSRIKAKIVERDEYDKRGIRAILNLGHTIGHALEAASKYSRSFYYHGEAVAIGIAAASIIASRMGFLDDASRMRITNLIAGAGLPTTISTKIKMGDVMKAQAFDKKMLGGKNRFVLPRRIGKAEIFEDIPRKLIMDVLAGMQKGGKHAAGKEDL